LGSAPSGAAAANAKEAIIFDESKIMAFGITSPSHACVFVDFLLTDLFDSRAAVARSTT